MRYPARNYETLLKQIRQFISLKLFGLSKSFIAGGVE